MTTYIAVTEQPDRPRQYYASASQDEFATHWYGPDRESVAEAQTDAEMRFPVRHWQVPDGQWDDDTIVVAIID